MIEVSGEGLAESSAGRCEVVAGEGGGVGGRHNVRVGKQWPIGGGGAREEQLDAEAGLSAERGTAGNIDEPGARADRSEHSVVNEGRLPGPIASGDDDGIDVG